MAKKSLSFFFFGHLGLLSVGKLTNKLTQKSLLILVIGIYYDDLLSFTCKPGLCSPGWISLVFTRKKHEAHDHFLLSQSAHLPLRVTGVEFHLGENRRNHKTDRFEEHGFLVRRGQPFVVTVRTNRSMDYPNEKMHFKFSIGE